VCSNLGSRNKVASTKKKIKQHSPREKKSSPRRSVAASVQKTRAGRKGGHKQDDAGARERKKKKGIPAN